MNAIKEKQSEDRIKDVIDKMIPEKRRAMITSYAQEIPGPWGLRLVDERAFQNFQNIVADKPDIEGVFKKLKEMLDERGEVPMIKCRELAGAYGVSETTLKFFIDECQRTRGLCRKPFEPKNEAELNFFIEEAAYFSDLYKGYHLHHTLPTKINSAMERHTEKIHEYYQKTSKKLAELGFNEEECCSLLEHGLTPSWLGKLNLISNREALLLVKEYPSSWREENWFVDSLFPPKVLHMKDDKKFVEFMEHLKKKKLATKNELEFLQKLREVLKEIDVPYISVQKLMEEKGVSLPRGETLISFLSRTEGALEERTWEPADEKQLEWWVKKAMQKDCFKFYPASGLLLPEKLDVTTKNFIKAHPEIKELREKIIAAREDV